MAKINRFAALLVAAFSLTLIMVSLPNHAHAQNPESYYEEVPRTFYGGLILGANFSQIDGDNYAGYHKVGFNVGGIVYTHLAEHLAASLEILFSQKGSKSNHPSLSNNQNIEIETYNIRLNYAEVPIQLNYFDKRKSHFGAGFSFSRIVSVNETIETNPTLPASFSFTDYPFEKWDYNFIIGGNLHLVKGLFLNARFQYSLANIRKNGPIDFARATQYNNLYAVRLMYLF